MITFPNPITIQPPSVTLPDGTKIEFPVITLKDLDYNVLYSNSSKFAKAKFKKLPIQLTIWQGDEYDAVGEFTDADVDARIKTLLGDNPQETLQGLFSKQA